MSADQSEQVAVIGLAVRLPGADQIDRFWENLRRGVRSISSFSTDELLSRGLSADDLALPGHVPAAGVIDEMDGFDADLFGMTAREAELMDPQQRVMLECAWAALESAGYPAPGNRAHPPIAVYAGSNVNEYLLRHLGSVGRDELDLLFGRDLASVLAERLNLCGPSITVQTACSTALVATHLACQALLGGECELALVGAVSLNLDIGNGYRYRQGGLFSADGHCRSFDAGAGGTVPACGAGAIVLKRLADAIRDRDFVHGVVLGSALNHDGGSHPSFATQVSVVAEAIAISGIEPSDLGYVEAMGVASVSSDVAEVAVLTEAFRILTRDRQFCCLGSVKPNIGHLGAASGIAMLAKVLAVLRGDRLPPSIDLVRPNPALRLETSPFFVSTDPSDWRTARSRRAGVGVFGGGSTNAYLVLQEPPPPPPTTPGRTWQLMRLSAASLPALARARRELGQYLRTAGEDVDLADVAFTYQVGRRSLPIRWCHVYSDRAELLRALEDAALEGGVAGPTTVVPGERRQLVFFCPEPSARTRARASRLRDQEPAFRSAFDECRDILRAHRDVDLDWDGSGGQVARGSAADVGLRFAATCAIEVALARLWGEWGVGPAAVVGVGVGECAAACIAGSIDLADALVLAFDCGAAGPERANDRLRSSVRRPPSIPLYSGGWESELRMGSWIAVELGGGELHGQLSPACAASSRRIAVASLSHDDGARSMVDAAGRLWLLGVETADDGFFGRERRRRLPLPTYPFQRKRYSLRTGEQDA